MAGAPHHHWIEVTTEAAMTRAIERCSRTKEQKIKDKRIRVWISAPIRKRSNGSKIIRIFKWCFLSNVYFLRPSIIDVLLPTCCPTKADVLARSRNVRAGSSVYGSNFVRTTVHPCSNFVSITVHR